MEKSFIEALNFWQLYSKWISQHTLVWDIKTLLNILCL